TDVWPEHQVQEAGRLIRQVFGEPPVGVPALAGPGSEGPAKAGTPTGGSSELAPSDLTRALESALEASRSEWPTGLCRRLLETLLEVADGRKRSPAPQSRWYHLVGWCLRPGFGDPMDRFRVEQLWKSLAAPPRDEAARQAAARIPDTGADYWIMWRRLA